MTINHARKIFVTSNPAPDLDGVASAWAYAEDLRKQGNDAEMKIFGQPLREVDFVLRYIGLEKIKPADDNQLLVGDVVLVDTSEPEGVPPIVNLQQIIEVIDHRPVHQAEKFPRAKVQIELVGAAATLIAEKFHHQKIAISPESAWLLFSAIVSNTINFQAKVTTVRDRKMADWLCDKIAVPDDYIKQMFEYKSQFTRPLVDVLTSDSFVTNLGDRRTRIFQLEIVAVEDFISRYLREIENILTEFKNKEKLDLIFLTGIDVLQGFNMLVAVDPYSREIVSKVLKIKFKNNVGKLNTVIMRKEIVPSIKEYFKNK